jgi:hypothetical protein
MTDRCPVCRGSKIIRLPLYSEARADFPQIAVQVEINARTYPCPECAPTTTKDRIAIVQVGAQACARYRGGDRGDSYTAHLRHMLAHRIADEMLSGNMIVCEEGEPVPVFETIPLRATIGIVSPAHVATMQERIEQGSWPIVQQVADRAKALIRNWGSATLYGKDEIAKGDAYRQIDDAMREIEKERKMKPLN